MIKYTKGNLLDFPEGINVLVHQANCFHTMGGGIARQIAQRYPEAVEADSRTTKGEANKLGTFSVADLPDGKKIVNLYGQYSISSLVRMTSYDALANGLMTLRDAIEQSAKVDTYVIGLPKGIGCGLGGGAWTIVEAIIKDVFEKSKVPVVIVEYQTT